MKIASTEIMYILILSSKELFAVGEKINLITNSDLLLFLIVGDEDDDEILCVVEKVWIGTDKPLINWSVSFKAYSSM